MTDSIAKQIRRVVLEQSKRANVGHIGSALSVADIVAALYGGILRARSPAEAGPVTANKKQASSWDPKDPERDRFVLSKGHAMVAVYAAMFLKGWLSQEELDTYCGDGSLLGVHPEYGLRGVDFASGSLGQGLSIAAGAALAARLQRSPRRTFALLSDAECNEGSIWEAVMFAAHHKLANLIAFVDLNGQQALGYTDEVLSLQPLAERWRAFGWDVHEVDGHNPSALKDAVAGLDTEKGPPHVFIARTIFGKGVSYMQNQIKWHYWPMSDAEYKQALQEIGPAA